MLKLLSLKLLSHSRVTTIKRIGLIPTKFTNNLASSFGHRRWISTIATKPPTLYQRGYGLQLSESFTNKLKLRGSSKVKFEPVSAEFFLRIGGTPKKDKSVLIESTLVLKINRLVDIFNQKNEESPNGLKKEPDANDDVKEEIKLLVNELMIQSEFNIEFLKWVIQKRVFTIDAFHLDQDRVFFVQVVVRSCLKHAFFAKWDHFGSSFQEFIIQIWNDLPRYEAEAFCDRILSQVDMDLKEKAYNSILECIKFHVLPNYSVETGNRLLDEMVELGLSPSTLAYSNIFIFNSIVSRIFKNTPDETQKVKELYARHKSKMTDFGQEALFSLLIFYSTYAKNGSKESIALLEVMDCLINSRATPSRKNCSNALEASERLLDQFHPEWRSQESANNSVGERIQSILENSSHLEDISTSKLFSILLTCYHTLVPTTEESVALVTNLFQALVTSGTALERPYFESLLKFYCNSGYSLDFDAILQTLEDNNLTPSDKILYSVLLLNVNTGHPESALSLYQSLTVGQDPRLTSISQSLLTPENFSLLALASSKLRNLTAMKEFWSYCLRSGKPLSSICYKNAIEAFIIFIKPSSGTMTKLLFAESYEYLTSIKKALESNLSLYSVDVYSNLIYAHSSYCTYCDDAQFDDYQDTLSKFVLNYNSAYTNSTYKYIYLALKNISRRDRDLNSAILTETEKVVKSMLKHYVKVSCATYCALLDLAKHLRDDFLFEALQEQFQIELSKNHVLDPQSAFKVLELGKVSPSTKLSTHPEYPTSDKLHSYSMSTRFL